MRATSAQSYSLTLVTYSNSADAFNTAAADLELLAGVDHYFQILAAPDRFAEHHVAAAYELDSWDCWLQQIEADA